MFISVFVICAHCPLQQVQAASTNQGAARVDRNIVGVGETLLYTLSVTTSEEQASITDASPGPVNGFDILGSNTSSSKQVTIIMGGPPTVSIQHTMTYRLRAKREGKFILGPGTITLSGQKFSTSRVEVQVVNGRTATPSSPVDPDDMFNNLFKNFPPIQGLPSNDDPEEPAFPHEPYEASDPLAKIEKVPEEAKTQQIFARLAASEMSPVVGQQVLIKLFIYSRRPVQNIAVERPPGFADFAVIDMDQKRDKQAHKITIEDSDWMYITTATYAVFPLRSGPLTIHSAEIKVMPRSFMNMNKEPYDVHSKELTLQVNEPPSKNRPAGYVIGDVASKVELKADIANRTTSDGHAFVTLHMKGMGRIEHIKPIFSQNNGLHWSSTRDTSRNQIQDFDVFQERTIDFDVEFEKTGSIDLGNVSIHVWDVAQARYNTVTVPLETVTVQSLAPSQKVASNEPGQVHLSLPPPRRDVGSTASNSTWVDRKIVWATVAILPLAVLMAQGVVAIFRRVKRSTSRRDEDPTTQSEAALRDAYEAHKRNDLHATASSLMRALDRALEAKTGLRSRGLTSNELEQALRATSLSSNTIEEILETLRTLDSVRFAGGTMPQVEHVATLIRHLIRE